MNPAEKETTFQGVCCMHKVCAYMVRALSAYDGCVVRIWCVRCMYKVGALSAYECVRCLHMVESSAVLYADSAYTLCESTGVTPAVSNLPGPDDTSAPRRITRREQLFGARCPCRSVTAARRLTRRKLLTGTM